MTVLRKSSENQEIHKKLSQKLKFCHPVYIKKYGEYLVFYFICCIKKYFQISAFLKFPGSKIHLKCCIFFRCMVTILEEQLYGFYQFPSSKNHWGENSFLKSLVSRNVFKNRDFCQFLTSKIYDKI